MKVKSNNIHLLICILIAGVLSISCSDFLDPKPDGKLAVPTTINDLEALLNNNSVMNQSLPGELEESADNYYLTYDVFRSVEQHSQNLYLWKENHLFPENSRINAWYNTYRAVYTANAVLEVLDDIDITNRSQYNRIKGRALFLRALRYYHGAQIWAPPYDETTAVLALGLPLRTHTDFNQSSVRANVEETYQLIISDLKSAIELLPISEGVSKTIPNKAAAYGLLARVFLSMRNYKDAGRYADSCLKLHPDLLVYENVSPLPTYPFEQFNDEVIFDAGFTSVILAPSRARIESDLFNLYHQNDLRKKLFFTRHEDDSHSFRGGYNAYISFAGIASDEMYLIRAECNAREGRLNEALADLNKLLKRCWASNSTFHELRLTDPTEILDMIITERRKQLLYRGLRWTDLRRLNLEGAGIMLSRDLNGESFILPPNSKRYTLPIPDDVIKLSGISQNP